MDKYGVNPELSNKYTMRALRTLQRYVHIPPRSTNKSRWNREQLCAYMIEPGPGQQMSDPTQRNKIGSTEDLNLQRMLDDNDGIGSHMMSSMLPFLTDEARVNLGTVSSTASRLLSYNDRESVRQQQLQRMMYEVPQPCLGIWIY